MVSTAERGSRALVSVEATPDRRKSRLVGLDGIRGLAALFVVLHHCFLMSFPGYPSATGPFWADWLIYGHFAVAVFIVLSGFSLAVAPARAGWRLDSTRRFFRRRAWRILPTYWPALLMSLVIAWTLVPQPGEAAPTAKSVAVNGLLVQDIVSAPTPNGAFWSIAVEAQLYFVFPLLILLLYRRSTLLMVGMVTAAVAVVGVLAPSVSLVGKLMRFTPQFAVLFALGVAAAGVLQGAHRRSRPLKWYALAAAVPVVGLIAAQGSEWTIGHLFWVDLALGPSIALLIAAVATGTSARLVRFLDTRPIRRLGSFSYSLYLTHAPIVVAVYVLVVGPWLGHGQRAFLVTLALAVPLALLVARVFAAAFEYPFTRHKTWPALRTAMKARLLAVRASLGWTHVPKLVVEEVPATEG
jgi:peptidoglycan/LPS O-acetylase OafA/YrhL